MIENKEPILTAATPQQSPQKQKPCLQLTRPDDIFDITNKKSIINSMLSVSLTEKQMMSRPIIKDIIEKSTKKTVQHHNINIIPASAQLYKIPQQFDHNQYKFDSIPPQDPNFISTSSQKVVQINRRLSQSKNLPQRLQEIAQKNLSKLKRNARQRNHSAGDKRVSISGLISYNFNSVNARRSLGNIPDCPEEEALAKKVQSIRQKNSSHRSRLNKIINRKPTHSSIQRQSISNAAVCDFHTSTDKFLKLLESEKEKDDLIFGQKMEKLNCIKEYMEKQKVEYQQAKFIVEAIQVAQKKEPKKIKSRVQHIIDDDSEIEKRKVALKKKRVMPKHFYFTE